MADKIRELESENKRLREALEFYADNESWSNHCGKHRDFVKIIDADWEDIVSSYGHEAFCGGLKAREALERSKQNFISDEVK